jgi:hypothetical protein
MSAVVKRLRVIILPLVMQGLIVESVSPMTVSQLFQTMSSLKEAKL